MNENNLTALGEQIYSIKDISPKQLGVTSRQINYWIQHKLTPFLQLQDDDLENDDEVSKRKWVRLNLVQAVWVCIIKELLSLGTTILDLDVLAQNVWNKPRIEKYADKVFQKELNRKVNPLSENAQQTIKNYLGDELLMEHEFRTVINPFTDMVKSVILTEGLPHSMVYVPETIAHNFLLHDHELTLKLSSAFMEHPLISIPIVPIVAKVFALDFSNPKKELLYLSDIEKQIRDIVVFKKPKSVVIAFENDHIKPITITEQHKSKEQLARYILENKIAKGSKLLIEIRSQGNYVLTLIKK
ncbi:hypothetical protein [Algibacter sp. R77976]|uniref:hypothetical protein n=1 Tax=Algibacter sp. R77976 TaxID=3093873 RepID=UPI0037C8DEB1